MHPPYPPSPPPKKYVHAKMPQRAAEDPCSLLFINELSSPLSHHCRCCIFADDVKLYQMNNLQGFPRAVYSLFSMSVTWRLPIAHSKICISFRRESACYKLTIAETEICKTDEVRDLRMHINMNYKLSNVERTIVVTHVLCAFCVGNITVQPRRFVICQSPVLELTGYL